MEKIDNVTAERFIMSLGSQSEVLDAKIEEGTIFITVKDWNDTFLCKNFEESGSYHDEDDERRLTYFRLKEVHGRWYCTPDMNFMSFKNFMEYRTTVSNQIPEILYKNLDVLIDAGVAYA